MLFQNDIAHIDSEINQLLAQVEAARQKQAELTELDALTDNSLTQLKDVVSKIGYYAPGAITNLKDAVLSLFDSGDHGDDGGNEPTAPTPDCDPTPGAEPEADDFDIIALNGETGDCLTTDDLDDIDDAGTIKLTYAQAIKRRCGACWGYEVTSKGDVKAGFINRSDLNFMEAVNLERSGREFYETVESYLNKLYYNGQACSVASIPELDKPLVAGDRFWFGDKGNTGTVLEFLPELGYWRVQIDGAIGTPALARHQLHYIPSCLEGQSCDIDKAPLTGQSCMWGSPFASPLCSLLWEDVPLLGQHCIITPSTTENNEYIGTKEGEAMPKSTTEMVLKNANCGYLKLKADGRILGVYCWFSRKNIAEAWFDYFDGMGIGNPVLRLSQRSSSWKYEIRLTGLSMNQIERLSQETLWQKPQRKKTESPAQAAGIEPPTGWRQVQPQEASEPEQSEPEQAELPIYQRSDGGFEVEQTIKESASILEVGDVVEITGDRHPQHFGLVGTVESLNHFSELPLSVRTPRGLKGYLRSDLKFVSKGDKPQSQSLQSGQLLMGNRIVTSGNYIGEARISRLLNAKLGTVDKIATIQLAKDLKNLGFDPRLAASVMAGEDDASDF